MPFFFLSVIIFIVFTKEKKKYKKKFDFYDSTSIKIYNLDSKIRYELSILDRLDALTKQHSENVGNLCGRICQYLKLNKKFTVHAIICGYLHDIGKSRIPYEILSKPAELTDEEYEIMKTHTTLGYKMCMDDLKLRPYAEGALYHHEALNGSGYPSGLTKEKIPFVARIIRVADEYDALVTKRHYTTHVHISDTLKDMIRDAHPENYEKVVALGQLSENSKVGKISPKLLKVLFKVVIDDTKYEISCVVDYIDYLKDNIKRLELIDSYNFKMQKTSNQSKRDYYKEGMQMLFQAGENFQNYHQVLQEYRDALIVRETRINDLYNEIKIIKKLKV